MLTRALCALALVLAISGRLFGEVLNLNQITDAACRVTVGGGFAGRAMGSGTVFSEDSTSYYVLTNYHVVTSNASVQLEFFTRGVKSKYIVGTVIWRSGQGNTDVDFAIVRIPKTSFGNYKPRVIPLAPPGYVPNNGNYIASSGCPEGRWAQAWEGHITNSGNRRVIFIPAPVGGQSGSGIIVLVKNSNGSLESRIGAILTWRIGENQNSSDNGVVGGAIPIATLHSVWKKEVSFFPNTVPSNYKPCTTLPSCNICKKPFTIHAYGSDGKFYCPNSGYLPSGVSILYNSASQAPNGFYESQCPPGGCPQPSPYGGGGNYGGYPEGGAPPGTIPYGNGGGIFGFRGRSPRQPNPGVPPNGGGSPYDTPPPNIPGLGSPWQEPPSNDVPKPNPTPSPKPTPIPPSKDEVPTPDIPPVLPRPQPDGSSSNNLSKSLAELSKQLGDLQSAKEAAEAKVKDLESKLANAGINPISAAFKTVSNNPATSVISLAVFGGLFYLFWIKIGKNLAVKHLDTVEDLLQKKITERFGEESGKSAREVMEGVEGVLMNWLDSFLAERQNVSNLAGRVEQVALKRKKDEIISRLGFPNKVEDIASLKSQLMSLLEESKATEIKQGDKTGLTLVEQLITKLGTLDSPTLKDVQGLVDKLAAHEQKENDADVLHQIAKLSEQLQKLSEKNLTT